MWWKVFIVFLKRLTMLIATLIPCYKSNNGLMYVNWKLYKHRRQDNAPHILRNESSPFHSRSLFCFSPPPLSLPLSSWADSIPEESCTNKFRQSRPEWWNCAIFPRALTSATIQESAAAFTRILLCCLDTYISRLIAGAWPKKGKITVTNKFCPFCFTLDVLDSLDFFSLVCTLS